MAAKKVSAVVKLQLEAGKATPGPPVGSTLGPHGINIAGFTKEFNEKTASQAGYIIPVVITSIKTEVLTSSSKLHQLQFLSRKQLELKVVQQNQTKQKSEHSAKQKLKKSQNSKCQTSTQVHSKLQ